VLFLTKPGWWLNFEAKNQNSLSIFDYWRLV